MAIAAEKIRRFNQPVAITLSGNRTLSEADLLADVITFEGALTTNATVSAPKIAGGIWLIRNDTTGGYTVTFGDAVLASGQSAFIHCINGSFMSYGPLLPSQSEEFVTGASYQLLAASEMIALAYDGIDENWLLYLPQATASNIGRKITLYDDATTAWRSVSVWPYSGQKINGVSASPVLIESATTPDNCKYLYAVFVQTSGGWVSETIRAVDTGNVAAVVTLP